MKYKMLKMAVIAALASMLILCPNAWADQIVIAADYWCPFNCVPDSEKPGYMVELASEIFATAGHSLEYKLVPWARAIKYCRIGQYQGIIGAYKDDAPDFIFPKIELGMIGQSIFVLKDSTWRYQGVSSLSQIALGVIRDYEYSSEINAYIAQNVDQYKVQVIAGENALENNVRKLLAKRIDALIEAPQVFWHTASQMGVAEELKSAGIAVAPMAAYIAFSPATPQSSALYADMLADGVELLRKSGRLAAILQKYGLTDWRTPNPHE